MTAAEVTAGKQPIRRILLGLLLRIAVLLTSAIVVGELLAGPANATANTCRRITTRSGSEPGRGRTWASLTGWNLARPR